MNNTHRALPVPGRVKADLEIKDAQYGRGLFAINGFKEGDIITRYDGVRRVVSGANRAWACPLCFVPALRTPSRHTCAGKNPYGRNPRGCAVEAERVLCLSRRRQSLTAAPVACCSLSPSKRPRFREDSEDAHA